MKRCTGEALLDLCRALSVLERMITAVLGPMQRAG